MPTYEQDYEATAGNTPAKYIDPLTGQEVVNQQTTYATPVPGNQMGNARPLFNDASANAANQMFGGVEQRQMSLQNQSGIIQAPLYFKDQTGDGRVTQADVVKARTEGYKE
jgi:hypothetical protein